MDTKARINARRHLPIAMIPRGALGGAGAMKCGTIYITAQFMIISWSVACLFRYAGPRSKSHSFTPCANA